MRQAGIGEKAEIQSSTLWSGWEKKDGETCEEREREKGSLRVYPHRDAL